MTGMRAQVLLAALAVLAVEQLGTFGSQSQYPEARSDLQRYQDGSKCFPDIGEWICIYRNYYTDQDFGGSSKCIKYERYGDYENFTTQVTFTFGQNASTSGTWELTSAPCYTAKNLYKFSPHDVSVPAEDFYIIYKDCSSCVVVRHRYAANGRGCSLWRRVGSLQESNDCCEFIYDENCGSSPKYQMYDPKTCNF